MDDIQFPENFEDTEFSSLFHPTGTIDELFSADDLIAEAELRPWTPVTNNSTTSSQSLTDTFNSLLPSSSDKGAEPQPSSSSENTTAEHVFSIPSPRITPSITCTASEVPATSCIDVSVGNKLQLANFTCSSGGSMVQVATTNNVTPVLHQGSTSQQQNLNLINIQLNRLNNSLNQSEEPVTSSVQSATNILGQQINVNNLQNTVLPSESSTSLHGALLQSAGAGGNQPSVLQSNGGNQSMVQTTGAGGQHVLIQGQPTSHIQGLTGAQQFQFVNTQNTNSVNPQSSNLLTLNTPTGQLLLQKQPRVKNTSIASVPGGLQLQLHNINEPSRIILTQDGQMKQIQIPSNLAQVQLQGLNVQQNAGQVTGDVTQVQLQGLNIPQNTGQMAGANPGAQSSTNQHNVVSTASHPQSSQPNSHMIGGLSGVNVGNHIQNLNIVLSQAQVINVMGESNPIYQQSSQTSQRNQQKLLVNINGQLVNLEDIARLQNWEPNKLQLLKQQVQQMQQQQQHQQLGGAGQSSSSNTPIQLLSQLQTVNTQSPQSTNNLQHPVNPSLQPQQMPLNAVQPTSNQQIQQTNTRQAATTTANLQSSQVIQFNVGGKMVSLPAQQVYQFLQKQKQRQQQQLQIQQLIQGQTAPVQSQQQSQVQTVSEQSQQLTSGQTAQIQQLAQVQATAGQSQQLVSHVQGQAIPGQSQQSQIQQFSQGIVTQSQRSQIQQLTQRQTTPGLSQQSSHGQAAVVQSQQAAQIQQLIQAQVTQASNTSCSSTPLQSVSQILLTSQGVQNIQVATPNVNNNKQQHPSVSIASNTANKQQQLVKQAQYQNIQPKPSPIQLFTARSVQPSSIPTVLSSNVSNSQQQTGLSQQPGLAHSQQLTLANLINMAGTNASNVVNASPILSKALSIQNESSTGNETEFISPMQINSQAVSSKKSKGKHTRRSHGDSNKSMHSGPGSIQSLPSPHSVPPPQSPASSISAYPGSVQSLPPASPQIDNPGSVHTSIGLSPQSSRTADISVPTPSPHMPGSMPPSPYRGLPPSPHVANLLPPQSPHMSGGYTTLPPSPHVSGSLNRVASNPQIQTNVSSPQAPESPKGSLPPDLSEIDLFSPADNTLDLFDPKNEHVLDLITSGNSGSSFDQQENIVPAKTPKTGNSSAVESHIGQLLKESTPDGNSSEEHAKELREEFREDERLGQYLQKQHEKLRQLQQINEEYGQQEKLQQSHIEKMLKIQQFLTHLNVSKEKYGKLLQEGVAMQKQEQLGLIQKKIQEAQQQQIQLSKVQQLQVVQLNTLKAKSKQLKQQKEALQQQIQEEQNLHNKRELLLQNQPQQHVVQTGLQGALKATKRRGSQADVLAHLEAIDQELYRQQAKECQEKNVLEQSSVNDSIHQQSMEQFTVHDQQKLQKKQNISLHDMLFQTQEVVKHAHQMEPQEDIVNPAKMEPQPQGIQVQLQQLLGGHNKNREHLAKSHASQSSAVGKLSTTTAIQHLNNLLSSAPSARTTIPDVTSSALAMSTTIGVTSNICSTTASLATPLSCSSSSTQHLLSGVTPQHSVGTPQLISGVNSQSTVATLQLLSGVNSQGSVATSQPLSGVNSQGSVATSQLLSHMNSQSTVATSQHLSGVSSQETVATQKAVAVNSNPVILLEPKLQTTLIQIQKNIKVINSMTNRTDKQNKYLSHLIDAQRKIMTKGRFEALKLQRAQQLQGSRSEPEVMTIDAPRPLPPSTKSHLTALLQSDDSEAQDASKQKLIGLDITSEGYVPNKEVTSSEVIPTIPPGPVNSRRQSATTTVISGISTGPLFSNTTAAKTVVTTATETSVCATRTTQNRMLIAAMSNPNLEENVDLFSSDNQGATSAPVQTISSTNVSSIQTTSVPVFGQQQQSSVATSASTTPPAIGVTPEIIKREIETLISLMEPGVRDRLKNKVASLSPAHQLQFYKEWYIRLYKLQKKNQLERQQRAAGSSQATGPNVVAGSTFTSQTSSTPMSTGYSQPGSTPMSTGYSQPGGTEQSSTGMLKPASVVQPVRTVQLPGVSGNASHSVRTIQMLGHKAALNRLTRGQLFQLQLEKDQMGAMKPDCTTPFKDYKDAIKRLLKYHVWQERDENQSHARAADQQYCVYSDMVETKWQWMLARYQRLMLGESMNNSPTAERLMIARMLKTDEKEQLELDRRLAKDNPELFQPTLYMKSEIKQESEDSDDEDTQPPEKRRRSSQLQDVRNCTVVLSPLPASGNYNGIVVKTEPNSVKVKTEPHSIDENSNCDILPPGEMVLKQEIKTEIIDDVVPSPSAYTVKPTTGGSGLKMVFKSSPSHSACSSPVPSLLAETEDLPPDGGGSQHKSDVGCVNKFSDISDAEDNEDDVFLLDNKSIDNNADIHGIMDSKNPSTDNVRSANKLTKQTKCSTSSSSFANQFEKFIRSQSMVKEESNNGEEEEQFTPFKDYTNSTLTTQDNAIIKSPIRSELNQVKQHTSESSQQLSSFGFDTTAVTSGESKRTRSSGGASDKYSTLASLLTLSDSESESPQNPVVNSNMPSPVEIDLTNSPSADKPKPDLDYSLGTLMSDLHGNNSGNSQSNMDTDNTSHMDSLPLSTTQPNDTLQDEMQSAIDSILGMQQDWGY